MEENTGTQTKPHSVHTHSINRINSPSYKKQTAIYLANLMITIRHNNSLNYLYTSLMVLLSYCLLFRTQVWPSKPHFFPLPSFLSLLHCSELVSVIIQLTAISLPHNTTPPPNIHTAKHTHSFCCDIIVRTLTTSPSPLPLPKSNYNLNPKTKSLP